MLDTLDRTERRFESCDKAVAEELERILRTEAQYIRNYAEGLLREPDKADDSRYVPDSARPRIKEILERYERLEQERKLSEEKTKEAEMVFARQIFDGKVIQYTQKWIDTHLDEIPEELRRKICTELHEHIKAHDEACIQVERKIRYLEVYYSMSHSIMTDRS